MQDHLLCTVNFTMLDNYTAVVLAFFLLMYSASSILYWAVY